MHTHAGEIVEDGVDEGVVDVVDVHHERGHNVDVDVAPRGVRAVADR
jgi:hypothetical protein